MKNGSFSLFGLVKITGDVKENGYNFLYETTKIHYSKWREKGKEKIIFGYILSFCSYYMSKNFFFFFFTFFYNFLSSLSERKIKTISVLSIFYFIFMFSTFTLIFLN